MQQEKETLLNAQNRNQLKSRYKILLLKAYKKSQAPTIIFTSRASKLFFSICTDSLIYSCGYEKYILIKDLKPYILLVTPECCISEQLLGASYLMKKVTIINLNISNKSNDGLPRIREIKFGQQKIKGILQDNLDFYAYLNDVYVLEQSNPKAIKSQLEKQFKNISNDKIMVDRLCSFMCSYSKFYQYILNFTSDSKQIGQQIHKNLQQRFEILGKHKHSGYIQSSPQTKVVIFQRKENISPFIIPLEYGPLIEQLLISCQTKLLSSHSTIYNTLFNADLQQSAELLQNYSEQFNKSKKGGVSFNNFESIKKELLRAYNPQITSQQIRIHQCALKQILQYVKKNEDLIKLQRDIANGINEIGQPIKKGKVVDEIIKWATKYSKQKIKPKVQKQQEAQQSDKNTIKKQLQIPYEYFLRTVLIALETNNFWWFQRNQLTSGLLNQHKQIIKKYISQCNCKNLKQPNVNKDQNGLQVRSILFRHRPQIMDRIQKYLQQKNQQKEWDILKINNDSQNLKLVKQSRTIIYINDVIGYNQLAYIKKSLSKYPNQNIDIVCKSIMTARNWTEWKLWNALNPQKK